MRVRTSFYALAVLISFAGCKKKSETKEDPNPVSCFTPSSQFVNIGGFVNFGNCSTNYDRSEWNFGDGGSATITEPSYQFKNKGVYTVALKTYKGDVSNNSYKPVVVGESAHFSLNTSFSQVQDSSLYQSLTIQGLLYKTSNGSVSWETLNTTAYNPSSSNTGMGTFQLYDSSPSGTGTISENSTFRIKFRLSGIRKVYVDSVTTNYAYRMIDSVSTDVIDPFSGPKTPVGKAVLRSTTINYTISPISFY